MILIAPLCDCSFKLKVMKTHYLTQHYIIYDYNQGPDLILFVQLFKQHSSLNWIPQRIVKQLMESVFGSWDWLLKSYYDKFCTDNRKAYESIVR